MSVQGSSSLVAEPWEGGVRITLPPEFFEAVAQRAAEIVASSQPTSEDGWLRGADAIAAYIGAPRSRVYALAKTQPPRIPVHRDGSSYLAQRSELDAWVRSGGGKRP